MCNENNKFIASILSVLRNVKEPLEVLNKKGLNIFTAISDTYYKENLHSDIISLILNPFTPGIGNFAYLQIFLEEIDTLFKTDLRYYFQSEESIKISREKGYIDILIHDGENGIIIENKINNAKDKPNQLCRYYNYALEEKKIKNILMVIYLPFENGKMPPISDYKCEKSADYLYCKKCKKKNEADVIKKTLEKITIPLTMPDLQRIFQKCAEKADTLGYQEENRTSAKILIGHYAGLLSKLKDNNMEKKNLLNKIFSALNSSELKIEDMRNIITVSDIWNNRNKYIKFFLADYLESELKYEKVKYARPNGNVFVKRISAIAKIIFYPDWGTFALEMEKNNWEKWHNKSVELLRGILNGHKEYFITKEAPGDGEFCAKLGTDEFPWVHINISFDNDNIQGSVENIVEKAAVFFTDLEKVAAENIK